MEADGYYNHIGSKIPLIAYQQVNHLCAAFSTAISKEQVISSMRKLISDQVCATTKSMLSSANISVLNSVFEKTRHQHNT
eukprot:14623926-Ditylum_brightwellii.AAC.1